MINYVEMSHEHLDGLVEIEEQCFNSGFARQTFEKELENKIAMYVVAVSDGMVIGYAGLWNMCGEADIMNVGVYKDYRRQGIAENLMKHLIENAYNRGIFEINLEVRKSNEAARALYKKLKFAEVGLRKNYYEGTEDAVLMKLILEKEDEMI